MPEENDKPVMDIEFWNNRWQQNQTGFHQSSVNPYLAYFYGEKGLPEDKRQALKVFVPLCGKSLDMLWLAQQGYAVFGIECSRKAVNDFFSENGLSFQFAEKGEGSEQQAYYRHTEQRAEIEIYQGDFFSLTAEDMTGITDVFDRASLIAFPEDLRQQYAEKMIELQAPGTRTLLVTLSYDQSEMNGPPFAVSEQEVYDLYQKNFTIDKLMATDILEKEQRFKAKGLTALTETVYKLKRI